MIKFQNPLSIVYFTWNIDMPELVARLTQSDWENLIKWLDYHLRGLHELTRPKLVHDLARGLSDERALVALSLSRSLALSLFRSLALSLSRARARPRSASPCLFSLSPPAPSPLRFAEEMTSQ